MKSGLFKNKIIVITGGSSGIGLALAKQFVAQHAILVLMARNKAKLEAAKLMLEKANPGNSPVHIIPVDVSNKEAIIAAINYTGNQYGRIDVLINCAGIISCGKFTHQPYEDLEKCMQVNYMGSLYASKAAWPYLKTAKGQLSFVCSVAGFAGLIGYSGYAPSKFALTGLAECLRMEGNDDGIRISIIYPPDTDTPFLQYEHQYTLPECMALSKNIKVKSPEEIADKYIKGLCANKFNIYADNGSRMLRWFKNNFPSLFYYGIKKIVLKTRKQLTNLL